MTWHGIEYPIWLAGLGQPNQLLVKINPIPAEPRTVGISGLEVWRKGLLEVMPESWKETFQEHFIKYNETWTGEKCFNKVYVALIKSVKIDLLFKKN